MIIVMIIIIIVITTTIIIVNHFPLFVLRLFFIFLIFWLKHSKLESYCKKFPPHHHHHYHHHHHHHHHPHHHHHHRQQVLRTHTEPHLEARVVSVGDLRTSPRAAEELYRLLLFRHPGTEMWTRRSSWVDFIWFAFFKHFFKEGFIHREVSAMPQMWYNQLLLTGSALHCHRRTTDIKKSNEKNVIYAFQIQSVSGECLDKK